MTLAVKILVSLLVLIVLLAGFVHWRASAREKAAEARFPPEGRILDVGGIAVHAVISGQGPDLVLIHGASGNTRDFTFEFAQQLSDRFRVIVFDRPGLGWSDIGSPSFEGAWNDQGADLRFQAAVLQGAALQLGVRNPIVMGHSFGGAVALQWGISQPDQTAALVLVSSVSNPWPGDLGWLYQVNASRWGGGLVVPLLTAFAPQYAVNATLTSIFEPQDPPKGYLDYVGAGLTLRRDVMRANARQVYNLRPHVVDMVEDYGDLALPVEIVHGTADTIVPIEIHSDPLSLQIPGAVLTRLDGIGHMPHHVAPDDVIAAIDRAASRAGLR